MAEIIVIVLSVLIMFVPSIISFKRHTRDRWWCLVLNIMLGWFVLPWIALLAWSILGKKQDAS